MTDQLKPILSWRGELAKADLPPATKLVAYALSLYMNELGGSAHPGPTRLAAETGLNISTVKERLADLEKLGWLRCVERGGFRKGEKKHANVYEAAFPQPTLLALDPSSHPTVASGDPSSQMKATVASGDPIGPSISPTKTANSQPARTYQGTEMTAEELATIDHVDDPVALEKITALKEQLRPPREEVTQ